MGYFDIIISICQALTPLAIFVSALVAFFGVGSTLRKHDQIAKREYTLDIINQTETSDFYRKNLTNYGSYRERRKLNFDELPITLTTDQTIYVYDYLNHLEMIALAIDNDIIEGSLYRDWFGTVYVTRFAESQAFIKERQKIKPRAYILFESQASKWNKELKVFNEEFTEML